MTKDAKLKIKELLAKYCSGYESQNAAAKTLRNVSPGTISQLLNDKWELISDKMWINIGKQIGYKPADWKIVETRNYQIVKGILSDAQIKSRMHALIGGAGWGKDAGIRDYKDNSEHVYVVNCSEYFNKKYFMVEVLRSMGKSVHGTIPELVERAVDHVNSVDTPAFVINEVDKLKDEAFYFLITFYNLFEDKAGIVIVATDQLEKRITRGLFLNKKGYQEIFSRIGRRFIELEKPSKGDVRKICNANGVSNEEDISEIYNNCEGDLRRVKKLVQNKQMMVVSDHKNYHAAIEEFTEN